MGCNLLLLLLVSGLVVEQTHALLCYRCDNCESLESEGMIRDCPITDYDFCYTSKDVDTGEVTKLCGIDEINFLGLTNSCGRQGNQISCHCDRDLCNTNDQLPSAVSTIADTTTSTAASTGSIYCYSTECNTTDCRLTANELIHCTAETFVTACLYAQLPDGTEYRTCANEELDALIELGCNYLEGFTFCKCLESGCNEYPRSSTASETTPSAGDAAVTTTPEDFFCYYCSNCGSYTGVLTSCGASLTSRSCLYVRQPNGTESRACGEEDLDVIPTGCTHLEGHTFCRCLQSGCNEYPITPISVPTTTTTVFTPTTTTTVSASTTITTVSAPDAEPWTCYSCHDCGNSTGEIVTCSQIPAVTDCHLIKYPSGRVQRSCGRTIADTETVEFGCSRTYRGYQWCRCNERNCNEYPDITESGPDVTTATTMPDTTTAQQSTTAGEPPFSCYVCRNCGSTAGFLVDCSPYTESKTCLLMKQPNGEVLRLCSTTELDAQLRSGCHTRRGYTFCKCSENACNVYPEISGVTTTIPPTTTEPPFLCHICHDCGTELGPSLQCTSANSCSFILQQGIVIRSCGSPLLDLIITEDEGCTTTDDGQICKCSTPNCNIYSDITDNAN